MIKNTTQPVETIVRISEEDEPESGVHNVSNGGLADASVSMVAGASLTLRVGIAEAPSLALRVGLVERS